MMEFGLKCEQVETSHFGSEDLAQFALSIKLASNFQLYLSR